MPPVCPVQDLVPMVVRMGPTGVEILVEELEMHVAWHRFVRGMEGVFSISRKYGSIKRQFYIDE